MAVPRYEIACRDVTVAVGWRDQCELRENLSSHIAHPHEQCGTLSYGLEAAQQFEVVVEFSLRLIAGLAERNRRREHERRREGDTGDLHAVDVVHHVPCRQQLAGLGACGVKEVQHDGRTAAGNAVDRRVAVVGHHTVWCLHDGFDDFGGVEIEDFDCCGGITGGDETSFDCKWPHAGKHVSTVGCRVDRPFPNCDLCKQIVDVNAGPR